MRRFLIILYGIGIIGSLIWAVLLFKDYRRVEATRAQIKEDGVYKSARVVEKDINETTRVTYSTKGMKLFDTKLLTLMFNANDRSEDEPLISFTKIVKGEKDDQQAFNFVRYDKEVGLELYNNIEINDDVPIVYLKGKPEVFAVLTEEGEFYPNYRIYGVIGLLLFACLTSYLFYQVLVYGRYNI